MDNYVNKKSYKNIQVSHGDLFDNDFDYFNFSFLKLR